jgi:putative transposase
LETLEEDKREKFVEILAFCFMPNHIHLLLKQVQDKGVSKFMQKFGAGYAAYFKEKYNQKRKGYFFQKRFNSILIKTEDQLRIVFVYVHTNPTSLIELTWKEKGITNPEKVIAFLEDYKWSSYQDYIGKKNFPSVTKTEWISELMGGVQGCKKSVEDWIKYKGEIKEFVDLVLEE